MTAMIGVAALLGEERRCLKALKKSNATSPNTAISLIEISNVTNLSVERTESALQRLILRGKVEKTIDGKYYTKYKDKKRST
jgi:hypothetical protein